MHYDEYSARGYPIGSGVAEGTCDGRMQRIHEKLVQEKGIQVGYSTLTRMLRELELSRSQPVRCDRVPDEPGAEMQHDTTIYRVKLAGQWIMVIAIVSEESATDVRLERPSGHEPSVIAGSRTLRLVGGVGSVV